MNRRPFSESLFVARCVRVAACDYEVARCDFVARQSRASKSRVKVARQNRRCDIGLRDPVRGLGDKVFVKLKCFWFLDVQQNSIICPSCLVFLNCGFGISPPRIKKLVLFGVFVKTVAVLVHVSTTTTATSFSMAISK